MNLIILKKWEKSLSIIQNFMTNKMAIIIPKGIEHRFSTPYSHRILLLFRDRSIFIQNRITIRQIQTFEYEWMYQKTGISQEDIDMGEILPMSKNDIITEEEMLPIEARKEEEEEVIVMTEDEDLKNYLISLCNPCNEVLNFENCSKLLGWPTA